MYCYRQSKYGNGKNDWYVCQVDLETGKSQNLTGLLSKNEAMSIAEKLENGAQSIQCFSCRGTVVFEDSEPSGCPYCSKSWVD